MILFSQWKIELQETSVEIETHVEKLTLNLAIL